MKSALIVFTLATVLSATLVDLTNYSFQQYAKEFNRKYSGDELVLRKMIFEQNLREIIEHNKTPGVSYQKGVNQFTDRTDEEFRQSLGYHKDLGQTHKTTRNIESYQLKGVQVPTHFDWRQNSFNVVSPVKDQGRCGSCWTFAAAEVVESHYAIKSGKLVELSEQQIASCTSNPTHCGGTGGCSGGIAQLAFESIMTQGGLASEWTYPYISYQGTNFECAIDAKLTPPVVKLSGYQNIPENSYQHLIEALVTEGPISVSVDAGTFKSYSSGVHDGCNTDSPDINHAVVLVGYGVDVNFGPYWTIRNSWGPNWGENGYIRIRRSADGFYCGIDSTPQHGSGCDDGPSEVYVCGMCGILYDNTFPKIAV